jgi:hypothetical protein
MAQSHGCEFSNVETKHACQFALPMAFSQRPAVQQFGGDCSNRGHRCEGRNISLDRLQAKVQRRIRITSSTASMIRTGDTLSAIARRGAGGTGTGEPRWLARSVHR